MLIYWCDQQLTYTYQMITSLSYIRLNNWNFSLFAISPLKGKDHEYQINKHPALGANRGMWENCKCDTEERSLQPDGEACTKYECTKVQDWNQCYGCNTGKIANSNVSLHDNHHCLLWSSKFQEETEACISRIFKNLEERNLCKNGSVIKAQHIKDAAKN